MTDKVFHFVRNQEVDDWLRVGWIKHDSLAGTHHGQWSTLMEWAASGEPVRPFFVSRETVINRVPDQNTNRESGVSHERTEHRTQ